MAETVGNRYGTDLNDIYLAAKMFIYSISESKTYLCINVFWEYSSRTEDRIKIL